MPNDVAVEYLVEARKQFVLCADKTRHCFDQLNQDQIWWRAGEEFNSIGNLMLHINGNVRQRILSLIAGEPDNRDRDQEFAERGPIPKVELRSSFDDTMRRVDTALADLSPDRLLETRRYRMLVGEVQGTVLKLILQTLVHVGGHTQEIIALTRLQLRDEYRFQAGAPKKR